MATGCWLINGETKKIQHNRQQVNHPSKLSSRVQTQTDALDRVSGPSSDMATGCRVVNSEAQQDKPNIKEGGSRFLILHGLEEDPSPDNPITVLKQKIQAIQRPSSRRAVGSTHGHNRTEDQAHYSKVSVGRWAGKEIETPPFNLLKKSELQE